MVMPMSNPYAFPHSLGSQSELGRLEKRVNSYRRYHEAALLQSEAVAPALIDECQQQTERLRDRLVTSKGKKKRSEPRREAAPAAAASPAETTSAIKRTLEPEEDYMKQPKIEPGLESSLALTATATSTVNFVAKSEPVSSSISSSIGAGVVTTSCSSHSLPCGVSSAAAFTSNTSSEAAVKSEAAALMDDLFGETGDIDYEHVLRQLANGDDGAPPSTEIPDIGDLSRIIEGAEYGETLSQVALSAASSAVDSLFDCDVTTQSHGGSAGGPASAILRTMAERLGGNGSVLVPSLSNALPNDPSLAVSGSSGGVLCSSASVPSSSSASCSPAASSSVTSVSSVGGATCTTSTAVSPVPQPLPQLPSVSAAAIMHQQDGSGGPPKLTMQQRLKLKRQMMADEFRQTQYRQQQQQQQQQHSQLLQPTSMPQCSSPASSISVTASASLAPSTPLSYQQHQQHQLMMQQQRHHHQQQQMMMAAAQQQQQQMVRHPHQQQMMMMHPSGRLVAPGGAGTVMFAPSSAVQMQRYPVSGMESMQALPVQPGMTMAGQRMMLRPQGHMRPAVQHQMMAAHPQMMSQQMMHQQQLQHPHQQMAMAAFPAMQHPVQQQQQMTPSATSEQEFRAMAMSASSAGFRPHQFQ